MDELVVTGLSALGVDATRVHDVRRLAGGASGAGVFELRLDADPVVLKVSARPTEPGYVGRELRFYRELATRVPVRTPRLLAGTVADERDVLLLSRSDPAPPASAWALHTWLDVARQAGELHRCLQPAELAAADWLGRAPERPDLDARAKVWACTPAADIAEPLLAEFDQLPDARTALDLCLVHGDCHAQNLLCDGDQLVWADWQVVGHGRGPEDLALLWQRAEFNDADVPREATLAAYADARGIALDPTVRRGVVAAELTLLLLGWPAFLLRVASAGRDALFRQLRRLDAEWRH